MLLRTQDCVLQHFVWVAEELLDHLFLVEYVVEALELVDSEVRLARNEQTVLLGNRVDTEAKEIQRSLHEVKGLARHDLLDCLGVPGLLRLLGARLLGKGSRSVESLGLLQNTRSQSEPDLALLVHQLTVQTHPLSVDTSLLQ